MNCAQPSSWRPSVSNESTPPRSLSCEFVFFVDECLGPSVFSRLKAAGLDVRGVEKSEADVDWIPRVTHNGWVILTKDKRMRRHEGERALLVKAGARWVAFTGGKLKHAGFLEMMVEWMPQVIRLLRARNGPMIVQVNQTELLDCTEKGEPIKLRSYRRGRL